MNPEDLRQLRIYNPEGSRLGRVRFGFLQVAGSVLQATAERISKNPLVTAKMLRPVVFVNDRLVDKMTQSLFDKLEAKGIPPEKLFEELTEEHPHPQSVVFIRGKHFGTYSSLGEGPSLDKLAETYRATPLMLFRRIELG